MEEKKARLLHLSALIFAGFEESGFNKFNWLELAKGFDQLHLMARNTCNSYKIDKSKNIELHLMPKIGRSSVFGLLTMPYIFILIRKKKITHILCQSAIFGGLFAIWASKLYKIPVFVEIHGEEYFKYLESKQKRHLPLKWIINYVYKRADKIRSLNSLMTKKLAKFGFSKNVVEIPNRVNLTTFSPPKSAFIINDPIKIVSVGRFVKEKNYSQLIKALANSDLCYQLYLIGGGPLKNEYLKIINDYSINDKVTLIDWMDQKTMIRRIIESDVYVQFSISEGMPRTIIEAMALRMPIISTNVGSIEGVLQDGYNAIILYDDFSSELILALHKLYMNLPLREQLSQQAYQDVLLKYEWNKIYELYRMELLNMN